MQRPAEPLGPLGLAQEPPPHLGKRQTVRVESPGVRLGHKEQGMARCRVGAGRPRGRRTRSTCRWTPAPGRSSSLGHLRAETGSSAVHLGSGEAGLRGAHPKAGAGKCRAGGSRTCHTGPVGTRDGPRPLWAAPDDPEQMSHTYPQTALGPRPWETRPGGPRERLDFWPASPTWLRAPARPSWAVLSYALPDSPPPPGGCHRPHLRRVDWAWQQGQEGFGSTRSGARPS